jgi:hypothetical protein
MFCRFGLLSVFVIETVNANQQETRKRILIQPIGDASTYKDLSECGVLILNMLSLLLSTFMIEVGNLK